MGDPRRQPGGLRVRRTPPSTRGTSDAPAGRDLLALRALAGQPLNQLAKLGPDIAQSWRNGDAAAVDALAALELRKLGLKADRR